MEQQSHVNSVNNQQTITKLGEVASLTFQGTTIFYYKNPIILNQQYSKDIIPGVYEGGFQLWECELQFLKKIFEQNIFKTQFINKSVIQIGCGHGLLAIAAEKLGASQICLQDYNQNVIKELTVPTLNLNKNACSADYVWGDWQCIKNPNKYDIILGSEVTYRQQNYQKIINFIKNNMKKQGKCILANKSYYFGVGGNLAGFKQKVQQKGFQWKSLFKIVPKSGGNKKQIVEITFKK